MIDINGELFNRSRPKLSGRNTQIGFMVSDEELEWIDEMAKLNGVKRADLIRMALAMCNKYSLLK